MTPLDGITVLGRREGPDALPEYRDAIARRHGATMTMLGYRT